MYICRFRALSNMALDEGSQSGLAAGEAMIWCVRGLSRCCNVRVLRSAAHAVAAISYRSLANKARFARLGALSASLRVISHFGFGSLDYTGHYVPALYVTPAWLDSSTYYIYHPKVGPFAIYRPHL